MVANRVHDGAFQMPQRARCGRNVHEPHLSRQALVRDPLDETVEVQRHSIRNLKGLESLRMRRM
jgi:hypothetical protein